MTSSDWFVAAGVLFWIAVGLMDRSEKRRVHGTCTMPKAEQPYAPGTLVESLGHSPRRSGEVNG